MPCTYYTDGEEAAMARAASQRLRAELDKVTRLLCERLSFPDAPLSFEMQAWFAEHQEQDRKRHAAERQERKAERDRKAKEKAEREAAEKKQYEKLQKKYGKGKKDAQA